MRSCSDTDIDSLCVCGRLLFICADRLKFFRGGSLEKCVLLTD